MNNNNNNNNNNNTNNNNNPYNNNFFNFQLYLQTLPPQLQNQLLQSLQQPQNQLQLLPQRQPQPRIMLYFNKKSKNFAKALPFTNINENSKNDNNNMNSANLIIEWIE